MRTLSVQKEPRRQVIHSVFWSDWGAVTRTPQTAHFINYRNLLLTLLGAWKFMIKASADLMSDVVSVYFKDGWCLLIASPTEWRRQMSFLRSLKGH